MELIEVVAIAVIGLFVGVLGACVSTEINRKYLIRLDKRLRRVEEQRNNKPTKD